MSFTDYAYTAESGEVHRVRLEAETAAAGGFSATTGFTSSVRAKVSKNNGEFGLRPRGVRLSREAVATVGRFLPVADSGTVDSLVTAGTVTIGGETWQVISPVAEDY